VDSLRGSVARGPSTATPLVLFSAHVAQLKAYQACPNPVLLRGISRCISRRRRHRGAEPSAQRPRLCNTANATTTSSPPSSSPYLISSSLPHLSPPPPGS